MRALIASAAIAVGLAGAACYTTKQVTLGDLTAQKASRVWVTQPDQSVVLVNDAQIFRGNLVGFVDGKYRELPPGDLGEMRVRKLATARTVALLVGTAAVGTAVAVALAGGEDHFDDCIGSDECDEDTSLRMRP